MKQKLIVLLVKALWFCGLLTPLQIARLKYYYKFHKWPNFEEPIDLNEKINYLKFYGNTSNWSDLTDKYKVREYVRKAGLEEILVKLYGHWDIGEDIDWVNLPNQFVLKVNNGCGDILICRDKNKLNKGLVSMQFNKLVKKKYGNISGEPHYLEIKPCIIAEELLDINNQPINTSSLIDYKIWCFNGKPEFTWCAWNRTDQHLDTGIYDMNWNYRPEWSNFSEHYRQGKEVIPKPINFDRMMEIASILSREFPIIRVDLYEVGKKVYFGELTFTSLGGFMDYLTPEFLLEMGNKIDVKVSSNQNKN